jgi:hypothetical protein
MEVRSKPDRDAPGVSGEWRRFDAVVVVVVLLLAGAIAVALLVGAPRPLQVVAISPAAAASDVSIAAQVVVTFSRPLESAMPDAAVALTPPVDGFLSVAGRRAAFTPRHRFTADTMYSVIVSDGIRDRSGRTLPAPVVSTFRTRALSLLARVREGGLFRMRLGGDRTEVIRGPVGAFAASPSGAIAWVDVARHILVVHRPEAPTVEITLPPGLVSDDLEWAPGDRAVLFLGSRAGTAGEPFVVRLDGSPLAVRRLGGADAGAPLAAPLVTEALKRSLVEIVYGKDSYAVTSGGAIVRDVTWDFVVVDLDGRRRATVGPFLAIGDTSPRGDGVLVVDVDPADPALARSVGVYGRHGERRRLSARGVDAHSPRFSHAGDRVVVAAAPATGPAQERRFGLTVIDVDTAEPRVLTVPPDGARDEEPRWSPDDAWLLFRRVSVPRTEPSRVWIVPAAGGAPRVLAADADLARWVP